MALMKRTHIWILLLVISLVSCRRQKPQHDEIERVFNETYSRIWKCAVAECPPGMGLSVPCGTSVPYSASIECVDCVDGANSSATHDYSQCKSCMKCSANEKTSGHCTTSEDTTTCLKTCHKGFYWNDITDSCNSCSDCCGENLKHHEKQCEKSGLPISHQCRQSHVVCQRPTTSSTGRRETPGTRIPTANTTKDYPTDYPSPNDDPNVFPTDDPKQRSLSSSKIAGIVVGCILFAAIVLGIVIWKCCGWQRAKTILKNCCCCNRKHPNVMTFNGLYDAEENDSESAPCLDKSHSKEAEKKGLSMSGLPAVKRPGYHRMFSVPTEFNDAPKTKTNFHRSHSHPGCLKNLHVSKDAKDNKPGSPKKCQRGWSLTKKFEKKGYFSVPTDPELPDVIAQNPGVEREENPRNLAPPTAFAKDQSTSITLGLDDHVSTINPAIKQQCPMDQSTTNVLQSLSNGLSIFTPSVNILVQAPSVSQQLFSSDSWNGIASDVDQQRAVKWSVLSQRDKYSTKILEAPFLLQHDICLTLDIIRCDGKDVREFADKLGITVKGFERLQQAAKIQNTTTTSIILKKEFLARKPSGTVKDFVDIMKDMRRDDIIELIDKWKERDE